MSQYVMKLIFFMEVEMDAENYVVFRVEKKFEHIIEMIIVVLKRIFNTAHWTTFHSDLSSLLWANLKVLYQFG